MPAPRSLLALLLALLLAACGGQPAAPPPAATPAPPASTPTPAAAAPTDVPQATQVAPTEVPQAAPAEPAPLTLTSATFAEGEAIPTEQSCDGTNTSPALSWDEPPAGTQSLAVIMEDRDANNYTHWVLFNIPPETRELAAGIADGEAVPGAGLHAQNSFAQPGYRGPCPNPGDTHSYVITLYALDRMIPLEPSPSTPVSKGMVREEMQGHILGEGTLMGTYTRP